MNNLIPYGRHFLDEEDCQAVLTVLKGDWLTGGPMVDQFESKLCEITQADYAVACSNGTTALHLALLSIGIKEGDFVIVPSITFLSTANAARYVNAEVVFADIDPETGLMTAETLEKSILTCSKRHHIKAVINVHFAGQCENLEEIAAVAKHYNLKVIDDAAHAVGTTYISSDHKKFPIGCGKYCDVSTFSFHPVKTISLGEGGAITTNDQNLSDQIRKLCNHGMLRQSEQWINKTQGYDQEGHSNPWYYEMHEVGYNYRISDIHCALGISQLNKIHKFREERQKLVDFYDAQFTNEKHISRLKKLKSSISTWHLYILKIDFDSLNKTRSQVMKYLSENKIGSQVHYIPVYRQPYYERRYGYPTLPGAETYYNSCLSIPLFVGLKREQQEFIIEKIKKI